MRNCPERAAAQKVCCQICDFEGAVFQNCTCEHKGILSAAAISKRENGGTEASKGCSASPKCKIDFEVAAVSVRSMPLFPALASPPEISKVENSRRVTSPPLPKQGVAKKVRFAERSRQEHLDNCENA